MAFRGVLPQRGGERGKRGAVEYRAETRGCLCALGEPCKQHGEGRGDLQGEIGVY